MEIKELQSRIEKKQLQIVKIEKRLNKWQNALVSDETFAKEYEWNSRNDKWWNMKTGDYDLSFEEYKETKWDEYEEDCNVEIRRATRDLEEAKTTLKKYEDALLIEINKENAPKIQIIVDFLDNWKEQVSAYIHDNTKIVDKYYQVYSERCDFHNNRYLYLKSMSEEEYKQKDIELREKAMSYKEKIHPITTQVYKGYGDEMYVDEDKLNTILSKEAENKYWNLIEQVTRITGEIENISNLRLGLDGNLNGVVIGKSGNASVQTIGAGGYNIQCYHYRVLVHKV